MRVSLHTWAVWRVQQVEQENELGDLTATVATYRKIIELVAPTLDASKLPKNLRVVVNEVESGGESPAETPGEDRSPTEARR